MTINRLGQLMRLASTSLGTSTPAAAASDSRSVRTSPFCVRASRSVSASSVERCRRVSTVWIVSVSRTRHAAATVRSTPTTTARAATAAATSRSVPRRGSRRRGAPEVTEQRPVRGRHHGRRAERPVRDSRAAQGEHGAQVLVHQVVADVLGPQLAQRPPLGQSGHERRVVARAAAARRHHLGHPHAGVIGQEGEVGLVLDLLEPVEHEGGARVAVDAEAPDLAQPLRVGGVPAVDGELQAMPFAVGARRTQPRPTPGAPSDARSRTSTCRSRTASVTSAADGSPLGAPRTRWQAAADAPAGDDGGQDAERQAVAADDRAQGGEAHGEHDEPVHGPAQIRQPGECHGGRDGELEHGEVRIEARQRGHGLSAGVGSQQCVEQEADQDRDGAGQCHLAHRRQPRHQESEQDERHDDAHRPQEPQRGDQPADAGRRRGEQLGDVDLDRGVGVGQGDQDDDQGDGRADPDGVGSPPPRCAAAVWAEDERADTLAPRRVVAFARRRRDGAFRRRRPAP